MFWLNYLMLCSQVDKTPNGLAEELGISSGTVTGWKNGTIPSKQSLRKIADYFGLEVWDLLGKNETLSQKSDSADKKEEFELREDLRNNYAFRVLYDATDGATSSDMLEAAAVMQRRKEDRERR